MQYLKESLQHTNVLLQYICWDISAWTAKLSALMKLLLGSWIFCTATVENQQQNLTCKYETTYPNLSRKDCEIWQRYSYSSSYERSTSDWNPAIDCCLKVKSKGQPDSTSKAGLYKYKSWVRFTEESYFQKKFARKQTLGKLSS